jgi:hypothetical protein
MAIQSSKTIVLILLPSSFVYAIDAEKGVEVPGSAPPGLAELPCAEGVRGQGKCQPVGKWKSD